MGSLSAEVRTEVLCGRICDLEAENSKLRELLLDTLTTISWCTIDCCPSDNKKRELNLRACELGIELNDYELYGKTHVVGGNHRMSACRSGDARRGG